jgi:hypothetical protein
MGKKYDWQLACAYHEEGLRSKSAKLIRDNFEEFRRTPGGKVLRTFYFTPDLAGQKKKKWGSVQYLYMLQCFAHFFSALQVMKIKSFVTLTPGWNSLKTDSDALDEFMSDSFAKRPRL